MAEAKAALGMDIGGTRLTVAAVDAAGRVLFMARRDTPRGFGARACLVELEAMAEQVLDSAGGKAAVAGIGIGFGGPVDHAAGRVRRSHHVAGWGGMELANYFSERFGLPAWLENDANAGALAEALFGAGRGAGAVLYVNVGTGIGGGIVIGGRIWHGAHSNAAEIGHMVLEPSGPLCPCGKRGCLEALASGDAIGRRAREMAEAGELAGSALAEAPNLTGRRVGEYALRGDLAARRIIAEAGRYLGWGIAIAANLLDPDIVVVGGGVAELGNLYLEPAREMFAEKAMDFISSTPIVQAQLGYDAGVIGAAAVALAELNLLKPEEESP